MILLDEGGWERERERGGGCAENCERGSVEREKGWEVLKF